VISTPKRTLQSARFGGTMMENGRESTRLRRLKGASIAFGHGSVIDCTIRNISSTGACLAVASPVGIPDEFELVLSADEKRWPCTVVWRSANQIGVAFRLEERT
jgi:PilZ domain-containing protein